MRKFFFTLLLLIAATASLSFAQNATVKGHVTDAESGEALVGATLRVMRDSILVAGTYIDDAGDYTVEVAPGTYKLVFSYVSYDNKVIDAVTLAPGQVFEQAIAMGIDAADAGEKNKVEIVERVVRNNEGALLGLQRRSTAVVDVISNDQVQRAGDADAGAAMRRVTGVTVEGGRYIYVRGLGDRYSKTLLNGSEIPSLDPNRNAVQMDMFPSNLIDNIVVFKTFSPELPGSFTGGLVRITTKDFPQSFSLSYNSTLGFNTAASLHHDFLAGTAGKWDGLGFDDGTRAIPTALTGSGYAVPGLSFNDPDKAAALDAASKAFSTPMTPSATNSTLNHSHSFTIGDQKKLLGKPFGYVAGLSYNRTESIYENATEGRWQLLSDINSSQGLNNQMLLTGSQSNREVLWGGLLNFSWLPKAGHQLGMNYMHNQSGNAMARYLEGDIPKDDPSIIFQTRVTSYTQRSLDMLQFKGDHTMGKLRADWIVAAARSSQDEPDLRFFSNDMSKEDSTYSIQRSMYSAPSRYWRSMDESNLDGKLNFSLPFKQWSGLESKFQFGGAYTYKYRTFFERRFEFDNGSPASLHYNGDPNAYFSQENMGVIGQDEYGLYQYGLYVTDASELRNSYTGSQGIAAGYAMVDMPLLKQLRLISGARLETTGITLTSKDVTLPQAQLNNLDILPSLNLIYSIKPEAVRNTMNLRATYARTIARPVFRELAPYASFDFVGDIVLVGNPDLQRTLIDNLDLRWELFPSTKELVSVSAFYKHFQNPIELVLNPVAANLEGNFRNVPNADLLGFELEFRKSLDFIGHGFRDFRAAGNLTYIGSRLDINPDELAQIRVLNPEAPATRAMYGQSPYSINGELAYVNDSIGLNTSVNFNVFGPRIAAVSRGGTPNVYEQPRPSLDFSIGKRLGPVDVRFRARNILDPEYKKTQTLGDTDYVYSSYRMGRTFTLGVTYTIK